MLSTGTISVNAATVSDPERYKKGQEVSAVSVFFSGPHKNRCVLLESVTGSLISVNPIRQCALDRYLLYGK